MRLNLQFVLDKPTLPVDYRPIFVSFIKRCLSKHYSDVFEEYYSKQKPITKPLSFAVKVNRPIFNKDIISFNSEQVLMTFSVGNPRDSIIFYNAFLKSKDNAFPIADSNILKLSSVQVLQNRYIEERIVLIRFLSPLVVRVHSSDNKDRYLNVNDEQEEFQNHLKEVVKNEVNALAKTNCFTDEFSLEPIKAQATVVKSFGCMISASLGIFKLTGEPTLINFLYEAGMGSRRSEGFGLFEIIG